MIKKNLATVKIEDVHKLYCDYYNQNDRNPNFLILNFNTLKILLDDNDGSILEYNINGNKAYAYTGFTHISICNRLNFGEIVFV